MTMTPEEHRAQAERDLEVMREHSPAEPAYRGLVLSAIAHALLAVGAFLEPPPEPDIPGLPLGWRLETQQSGTGSRFWCYILTRPDQPRPSASRYQWGSSGAALMAGLRAAGEQAEREGLNDDE